MSDDDNGHSSAPPGFLFATTHEEDIRSLKRLHGMLTQEVRDLRLSSDDKYARSEARAKRIENLLIDLHARWDRALNAVDGLDVSKRLAVVEEALVEKPRRQRAGRK